MESHREQDIISIAKIGRTFGVKGQLHLYPVDNIDLPKKLPSAYISSKSGWVKHDIENTRPHKKTTFVFKIAGVDSPEEARRFTNQYIGILRSELPDLPDGEYYHFDLIGLEVTNLSQQQLGVIDHIMVTGANDVLCLKNDFSERLIPYTPQIIKDVNLAKQTMLVDWDINND